MTELRLPARPQAADPISDPQYCAQTLELLAKRRSTLAKNLAEPGPTSEELDLLIQLGSRVPDHGKLFPWRFIIFTGDARKAFSNRLAERFKEIEPDAPPERHELEQNRLTRAPLVIAVVSDTQENHKIPEWEQILSSGAVCQTLLIAAEALGYGAQWLTEWYAFDQVAKTHLGLKPGERVAGFIYIGTPTAPLSERARKPARIEHWGA